MLVIFFRIYFFYRLSCVVRDKEGSTLYIYILAAVPRGSLRSPLSTKRLRSLVLSGFRPRHIPKGSLRSQRTTPRFARESAFGRQLPAAPIEARPWLREGERSLPLTADQSEGPGFRGAPLQPPPPLTVSFDPATQALTSLGGAPFMGSLEHAQIEARRGSPSRSYIHSIS